jgi:phytoene desaturase
MMKIIIVGAGPGGLTAGLLLSKKGFDVTIFEKAGIPGGRNASFEIGGFKFDIGPTFLMMKYVLEQVFEECGYRIDDHLKLSKLSPMYRLIYDNNDSLDVHDEKEKMQSELERVFPHDTNRLDMFIKRETKRFSKMMPCLQKDYSSFSAFFSKEFLHAIPYFSLGKSLYDVLGNYFGSPNARLSFTFQSKYLGMSPWECPGAFAMIPFVEHDMGIYHVEGGLSHISEKMAELFAQQGGTLKYNTEVKRVILKGKEAVGVELTGGETISADTIIINADFGYAMTNLFPDGAVRRYTKQRLQKKSYSCSTYMLYLGLDTQVDLKHHTIVFARDYRKNVEEVFSGKLSGDNISFYVRNAGATDPTLCPKGKSQLYILVPAPNTLLASTIQWERERIAMRESVIRSLKDRLGLTEIEKHIVAERSITPDAWESAFNVHYGATFNLAHNLNQMLWFRPHNRLNSLKNCYLVGGGTHPGSGLPTIYESGRITANMILKSFGQKTFIQDRVDG